MSGDSGWTDVEVIEALTSIGGAGSPQLIRAAYARANGDGSWLHDTYRLGHQLKKMVVRGAVVKWRTAAGRAAEYALPDAAPRIAEDRWTDAQIIAALRVLGGEAREDDIMRAHVRIGGPVGPFRDSRRTCLHLREMIKRGIVGRRMDNDGITVYGLTGRRKRVLVSSKRR